MARVRRIGRLAVGALLISLAAYLVWWPVPVEPVAWRPPPDPFGTGPFAVNERLAGLERVSIGENHGPEAVAVGRDGQLYVATLEHIVRLDPSGGNPRDWVRTGGRPLGMAFDAAGNLIVADAFRGLLSISPAGAITELATVADGVPIHYADDVDVAPDGRIYFSDASTKFPARRNGTFRASMLEIVEHAGHGRLLVYDPATRQATTVVSGLSFANGVTMAHDGASVLVTETGSYRVLRVWLDGARRGTVEPFIDALPGFPDNITRGEEGRYWVALFAPRARALDVLAPYPFLRKVVMRLPAAIRPKERRYGHVVALDSAGGVVADLQDPSGAYPTTTSVRETPQYLYIGSLTAPALARLKKPTVGSSVGQ
jgi:sugar lactone lactonase YvrE